MRKIVLSALIAAGIGLAGVTGAAAAPASPAPVAAPATLVTPAQVIIVGPRHYRHRRHRYRYCYNVRRCWRGAYGRRVCAVRRVCNWRWR